MDHRPGDSDKQIVPAAVRYLRLARLVAFVHIGYALFAALGGLLVLRYRWLLWPHLVALFWALGTLSLDWGCPLTPLEKSLRERAGVPSYEPGFVQHYFLRTNYSESAARRVHLLLALVILLVNVLVYDLIFHLI